MGLLLDRGSTPLSSTIQHKNRLKWRFFTYLTVIWIKEKYSNISQEKIQIIETKLEKLFSNCELHMAVSPESLDKIVDEGFKNAQEVGKYPKNILKFRNETSKNLFGYEEKIKKNEYEKYGYLGCRDFWKTQTLHVLINMAALLLDLIKIKWEAMLHILIRIAWAMVVLVRYMLDLVKMVYQLQGLIHEQPMKCMKC